MGTDCENQFSCHNAGTAEVDCITIKASGLVSPEAGDILVCVHLPL